MEWNKFLLGNAFDIMPQIEDKSVELIFSSLPDISQTEYADNVSKYQQFQTTAMNEFARIIKDDGFVVISQTDRKINGSILPNHITYYNAMMDNLMILKDYKIIVRNQPVDKKDMYRFNYQHCSIFTKKGKIQRGGEFLKNILIYDTEKIGNIKGALNSYMWPKSFCELIIEKLTKEGDKVFDPFAASGIALSVAKNMNRKYLGCEKSEEVFNNAIKI